jgi:integrase
MQLAPRACLVRGQVGAEVAEPIRTKGQTMPKKLSKQRIVGKYFIWLLGQRDGVYTADGRSNRIPAGRHSLGSKNYQEALDAIQQLDLVMAVKLGLADRSVLDEPESSLLGLEKGKDLYLAHVQRPRVAKGTKPGTPKRYRAVLQKFLDFAAKQGLTYWNQVNKQVLEQYAAWLDGEGYAYRTEFLELTTLKQAINWMIDADHLPASCRIKMPLNKPRGTDTYCWRAPEIAAIVEFCKAHLDLAWLGRVVIGLACTGMRISELASLRWSDVDLENNTIELADESASAHRRDRKARQTKSGRGRSFPIHEDFRRVLQTLEPAKDGLVFHGPRGGVLSPDIARRTLIREVLTPLAKRFPTPQGEIGFAHGRLHSFRHYFCSTCANSGVPEQVVMQWLGHQSSNMVRHYYHLHDEEAQRQMQKLSFVGKAAAAGAADGTTGSREGPRQSQT